MEKKTLGSFLAALRKANGMTQKELAEKLAVSDKAVSRWERDECCPDLTLIPAIADIFGITSDELLRGQRNNASTPEPENGTPRSKKQLQRILQANGTRMQIRSLISAGVGTLGLLAAMICNLGFLRAYLGFFIACGFYLAGTVMELCFSRLAQAAVALEEPDTPETGAHKLELRRVSRTVYAYLLILFAVTLPLLTQVWDAYMGLSGGSWLILALIYGGLTSGAMAVIRWLSRLFGLKREQHSPDDTVRKQAQAALKLQKRVVLATAAVLAVTFLGQALFNTLLEPEKFVQGLVFETMEQFRAYAEQDVPLDTGNSISMSENLLLTEPASDHVAQEPVEGSQTWYDEVGNPISEEEALKSYLFEHGDERYAYIRRNPNIARIACAHGDFPVTVYTHRQLSRGNAVLEVINRLFVAAYVVEIGIGILVYHRKKKRIS